MKFDLNFLVFSLLVYAFFGYFASSKIAMATDAQRDRYLTCDQLGASWRDVGGVWVSAVGPLELEVEGKEVKGIYNQRTWAITLEYSSDKKYLFGEWDHLNGLKGPVVLLLADNGCIKHGLWGAVGTKECTPANFDNCVNNWAIHGIKISN